MMRVYLCLILSSIYAGCSISLSFRGADDGYDKVDKARLHPFEVQEVSAHILSSDTLLFVDVTSAEMRQVIQHHPTLWVMYWSSWCGHSSNQLAMYQALPDSGIAPLALISTDYKLKTLSQDLTAVNYKGVCFIISSSAYGADENKKFVRFRQELTTPSIIDTVFALPYHDFFVKGKYVGSHMGTVEIDELPF